jgi:hypothetical protein
MFANNMAEQERYYITNVLTKPQRIEKLNSYISQLPCWYFSPSAKMTMIPMNMSFAKADLAIHVLRMCSQMWQDQFNLHKNGMTPVDISSLLLSLKVIECMCTQERSNEQSNKNASHKSDGKQETWY